MKANADIRHRIEERAAELAMIHGGKPTPEDWTHSARELLGLQTLSDPDDPLRRTGPAEEAPAGLLVGVSETVI